MTDGPGRPDAGMATRKEFDAALKLYPALIKRLSKSKSAKTVGKTVGKFSLEDLDVFRFETAPTKYQSAGKKPVIPERGDILRLVEWKLKHGTFRPKLMALVESNSEKDLLAAVEAGFRAYEADGGKVTKAIKELTALKGIGPATASLILSIHDPAKTIFFSDEAFLWLCCGCKKIPIKYNAKEYEELVAKSRELMKRLNVDATEVEKVAFVLMRDIPTGPLETPGISVEKRKLAPSMKRKAATPSVEPDGPVKVSNAKGISVDGVLTIKDAGTKRRRIVKKEEPTAASKRPRRTAP